MASYIETLLLRSEIAVSASRYLRSESGREICAVAMVSGAEEIAVVPAAPYESAVVTFHRMESIHSKTVVLASKIGNKGALVVGSFERASDNNERTKFDLIGEMTTEEWLMLIKDGGMSLSFTANGNEFAPDLSNLSDLATV